MDNRTELTMLAEAGALNPLGEKVHRRDALWQVERAGRQAGPLLAAFRLRQQRCMRANTVPIREQVRNSVKFVRLVWGRDRTTLGEEKS